MPTSRETLLLNHEIASVITAMRHNAKWAMVPRYYVRRAFKGSRAVGELQPGLLLTEELSVRRRKTATSPANMTMRLGRFGRKYSSIKARFSLICD